MNFSAKIGRFTRKTGRNEASVLSTFDNFRWGIFSIFAGSFAAEKRLFASDDLFKTHGKLPKMPIFEKSEFSADHAANR